MLQPFARLDLICVIGNHAHFDMKTMRVDEFSCVNFSPLKPGYIEATVFKIRLYLRFSGDKRRKV